MAHLYLSDYDACTVASVGRQVAATPLARYKGKPMYRVPVCIKENSSRLCKTLRTSWTVVTARSATDAANWVRDRVKRPETEIVAIGPKGGEVHRYVGWESYIGSAVFGAKAPKQLDMFE
jgi:hypothetical protein